jgi:hypothetical protein
MCKVTHFRCFSLHPSSSGQQSNSKPSSATIISCLSCRGQHFSKRFWRNYNRSVNRRCVSSSSKAPSKSHTIRINGRL